MALHGIIKLNGRPILSWYAVRIDPPQTEPAPDAICTYDCAIHRKDEPTSRFLLSHRYGDGAQSLAALVLTHSPSCL